jgi:hypothetical protein
MNWLFIIGLSAIFNLVSFMPSAQSEMFIFPTKGQSADQQELDEFTCYKWAKNQTGVDPNRPAQAPTSSASNQSGGALRGAMGGAALGAIGGAIAGNAGKGAAIGAAVGGGGGAIHQRRGNRRADEQRQQAAAQQQQSGQTFNRAYGVCLEGKGYKVG